MTQTREQWLAERRTGLGGSDAAAALGLNPWKTPYQLYLEKRGEIANEDLSANEAVEWGNRLESVVLHKYGEYCGIDDDAPVRIVEKPPMLRNDKYPFMLANLDAYVATRNSEPLIQYGIEVKTASSDRDWGEPETDKIPQHYLYQVQHYMAVTNTGLFDVPVLFNGREFRVYRVNRDEELIGLLIAAEAEFWSNVQNGIPPNPVSLEDAIRRYPRSHKGSQIDANIDIAFALGNMLGIESKITSLTKDRDAMKQRILAFMGEHDTLLIDGQPAATWKTQTTKRISSTMVKERYPEIANECTTATDTRIFRKVLK